MASIRRIELRDGTPRWECRIYGEDGRRRSRLFPTKAAAERWGRGGAPRRVWRMTTAESKTQIDQYAWDYLASLSHLKPKTVASYESLLRSQVAPYWAGRTLEDSTPMDVRRWTKVLVDSQLSASRIRQAHLLLKMVVEAAVEDRLIPTSWVPKLKLNRSLLPKERCGYGLTEAQLADLSDAMPERYRALPVLIGWSGLRWGEACALRRSRCLLSGPTPRLEVVESVTMVGAQLHWGTPKNHKSRVAMLPVFAAEALARHLAEFVLADDDALVFTSPRGFVLRAENFRRRVWKPAVRAAGLPNDLRPHDLRDTCATLLIKHGASIKTAQEQIGHTSAQMMLDRYVHSSDE